MSGTGEYLTFLPNRVSVNVLNEEPPVGPHWHQTFPSNFRHLLIIFLYAICVI